MKKNRTIRFCLLFLAGLTSIGMASSATGEPVTKGMVKAAARAQATFLGLAPLDPVTLDPLAEKADLGDALPTVVKGYYSDGSAKDFTIAWSLGDITEEQVRSAGTFTVSGSATDGVETYGTSVKVTIREVEKVIDPVVRVFYGAPTDYELPASTLVVYTDGSHKMVELQYPADFAKPSIDTVGKEVSVKATTVTGQDVTVLLKGIGSEGLAQENVAKDAAATIDFTNSYDTPGIMTNGTTGEKGLSNWECRDYATPEGDGFFHATVTLNQATVSSSVVVWFWTGESNCELPRAYQLEIDSGDGTFVKVDAQPTIGSTDPTNAVTPYTFALPEGTTVKQVRLGWNQTENGSQNGKWCNISEIQVMAPSGELQRGSDAGLGNILVNGTYVPNFSGFQYSYTYEVPYDTEEVDLTPVLNEAHGIYYVQEGEIGGAPYRIHTLSEDLSDERVYTVYIHRGLAPAKSATIALASETASLLPGESVEILVNGTAEDGTALDRTNSEVRYFVENIAGEAEVRGNSLYGIASGYVRLSASLTYGGKTVNTAPLLVAVEKSDSDATLQALSIDKKSVTVDPSGDYVLPETVAVHYQGGLTRELPVAWNNIPENMLAKAGTFTLQGYVQGVDLLAELDVTVIASSDIRGTYGMSFSGQVGVLPTLPTQLPAYQKSNGEIVYENVTWDSTRFASEYLAGGVGTTITTWYYFNSQSNNWRWVTYTITEGEDSADHADRQNGYMVPASFTSTAVDGETALPFTDAKSVVWSPEADDENPYFGFVFGDAGNIQSQGISSLGLHFRTDEGYVLPDSLQVQYFDGSLDYSDLDTSHLSSVSTWDSSNPLVTEGNWKNVSNQSGSIAENTTLSFDHVETTAFRVLVQKGADATIGIDDVKATEKIYSVGSTAPKLASIAVTGLKDDPETQADESAVPTNIYEEGKTDYTVECNTENGATVTASLAAGEMGTVLVLPDLGDGIVRVTAISEDGQASTTYTVRLQKPLSFIKDIVAIEQPQAITVSSASTAEGLSLPETVTATLADGNTAEVQVRWDTRTFSGKKGEYVFKGTLDTDLDTTNKLNLTAQIRVTVEEDAPEEEIPVVTPETTEYNITIEGAEGVLDGSMKAEAGDVVFLVAKASSDKKIASVRGVDGITDYGNGTFSFVMPEEDVTLTVTLEDKAQSSETPVAEGGLDGGDIAAIALGVVLGVVLIGGGIFFLLKRKK